MEGKTIVLGVTGGIAVYKAAALCSKLAQAGARVRVIMTESACRFVTPLTFQTLSRNEVYTDTFAESDPSVVAHIDVADSADLVVVAPATANIIGKLANGIADDMLSTTLLATPAPILLAPAMNGKMYAHPAVQHNLQVLQARGVGLIEPGQGLLACGYVGKGRLAEPEDIFAEIARFFARRSDLQGKNVLVTAGGTVERIDPVRYLTNDSSGKMGFAVAAAARDRGANVTVVAGKTTAAEPGGVEMVRVGSAREMLQAVLARFEDADIVVKAAAVADYRPETEAADKIKKTDGTLTLNLVKNPDILETLGKRKSKQFLVGFAAETERLAEHAADKLKRKRCDLLVANDVTREGAGFGTDTNAVHIFDENGRVAEWPVLPKREVAERLLDLIVSRLPQTKGRS